MPLQQQCCLILLMTMKVAARTSDSSPADTHCQTSEGNHCRPSHAKSLSKQPVLHDSGNLSWQPYQVDAPHTPREGCLCSESTCLSSWSLNYIFCHESKFAPTQGPLSRRCFQTVREGTATEGRHPVQDKCNENYQRSATCRLLLFSMPMAWRKEPHPGDPQH